MEKSCNDNENVLANLPEDIWIEVLQYLEARDIKNFHLSCKKFDSFANNVSKLHKLCLHPGSLHHVITRLCREVEFFGSFIGSDGWIMEFFNKTGKTIKKLSLWNQNWDQKFLIFVLKLTPNIVELKFNNIRICGEWEVGKSVKLPKLKKFHADNCELEGFYELVDCNLDEASFNFCSGKKLENFLRKQINALSKLKLVDIKYELPNLNFMRQLKHLYIDGFRVYTSTGIEYANLNQRLPKHLNFLHIESYFVTSENLKFISDLTELESLEIDVVMPPPTTPNAFNCLRRLRGLKRFAITGLWFLEFGDLIAATNENLIELEVTSINFSIEEMRDLSRHFPNLQKLKIGDCTLEKLAALQYGEKLKEVIVRHALFDADEVTVLNSNIKLTIENIN